MSKCFLVLQDGAVFEGTSIGADVPSIGELVFTTGAGGYMGTLTDPKSAGQIVIQTFPEIGNYGIISEETETPGCHFSSPDMQSCHLAGYVVRSLCPHPSNFRSEGTLEDFLKKHSVTGIAGVDTRQLTRILRDEGSMNATIVKELTPDLEAKLKAHKSEDLLKKFKTGKLSECPGNPEKNATSIGIINYGAPHSIVESLQELNCKLTEGDYETKASDMHAFKGIVLSDGPGNPMDAPKECIDALSALIGKIPILAIGLGHQLLALALGGKTEKLKHGHRGANQPIKRATDGHIFITTQNQSYFVKEPPAGAEVTHTHVGDGTIAALRYPKLKIISVEFTPIADTADFFTEFLKEVHA